MLDSSTSSESSAEDCHGQGKDLRLNGGVKRARSSSESPVRDTSRSSSPEISYGDKPASYRLCSRDGESLILKIPMTEKKESRRCSDRDIALLLDTASDDEEIFDRAKRSRASAERSPVKNIIAGSKIHESPGPRGPSLRIKLRRSTEQSNYKIQEINDAEQRRSSPRINLGTPKRCGLARCDEHREAAEPRTPKSARRREDESRDDEFSIGRRYKTRAASSVDETPRGLADSATPRSARSRRIIPDCPDHEINLDKENGEKTPGKRTPRRRPGTSGETPLRGTATPSRRAALTPSMIRRTGTIVKPASLLEEARANLHVSAVPKSLPCREVEFNDIYRFVESKLLDKSSGCIYISGVPGTGKTATVCEVVRCLRKLVDKGEIEYFEYIEINGMKLAEPHQAYVAIAKQMRGRCSTWEEAYSYLDNRFAVKSYKGPMTLLLVDELDLLCNRRQDVIYNLLDWPGKQSSRLVVMTIANTMDLPERVLLGRVTSRLGLTRLTFQPYTYKQLQEIVIARLKASEAFRNEAIELVSRKVAAVSGDARRALDICRRATEIAEIRDKETVTMEHVNIALMEMMADSKIQTIRHCSNMEKFFLRAVCTEVNRTGVEETVFQDVYKQFSSICSFEGIQVPNVSEVLAVCARLGSNRLLLCDHSRSDILQRVLLNVSSDDVRFAIETPATI